MPSEEEKEKEREREREREPPPVDEEQVEISVHCIDGMDGEVLLCVNGTRRMCFTVDKKIFEHGNPDRFLFTVPKNADPLELSVAIYEDRGLKYLEADGIINIRQYRYEPAIVTPFTLLRRAPPAYRDDDNEARLPRFGRPPLDVYLSIEYVPERERERVPKM